MNNNNIDTWDFEFVEDIRKESICIGKKVSFDIPYEEKQRAVAKLKEIYSDSAIYGTFAEKILILSKLYDDNEVNYG